MSVPIVVAAGPPWIDLIARAASSRAAGTRYARDCAELLAHLSRSAELVLLDPTWIPHRGVLADLRSSLERRNIPCAFCASLSPASMRAVVAAASLMPVAVFLTEEADTATRLDDLFDELGSMRAGRAISRLLDLEQCAASMRVREVLQRLTLYPEQYFDAVNLARDVGVSRRHLDRTMRALGYVSGRRMVVAVRALHAVERMYERGMSATDAATSLGYANRVVLARHLKAILGVGALGIPGGLDHPMIVERARRFVILPHRLACPKQDAVGPPSAFSYTTLASGAATEMSR